MIYLLLSVLLSSIVTLLFKVTDKLGLDDNNLILVNYILASIVSISISVKNGLYQNLFSILATARVHTLFAEKTPGNTYLLLLLIGIVAGLFYIVDLFNTRNSVVYNGAGVTALFGKFGFLFSTTIAIFLWREIPTGFQIPGVILAVTALLIASGNLNELRQVRRPWLLAALVLMGGGMELCSKCAVFYTLEGYTNFLVSTTFPTAMLLSIGYTIYQCLRDKKQFHISAREILFGLCLGLPNVTGNYLSLKALETVPANIFFPTNAAGNLLVVSLASIFIFKEQVTKRQKLSIIIMVISLILLNI